MKYLITISLSLITLVSFTSFNQSSSNQNDEVYICVSNTAEVYHSDRDCWGLNKCTHDIKKVTLKEAVYKYKRRYCKIEQNK